MKPQSEQKILNPCTLRGIPQIKEHCILKADIEFQNNFNREIDFQKEEDLSWLQKKSNEISLLYGFGECSQLEIRQLFYNKAPTIITTAAIIASLMSNEVVKLIHELNDEPIGRVFDGETNVMNFNGLYGTINLTKIVTRKNCEHCSSSNQNIHDYQKSKENTVKIKENSTIQDFVNELISMKIINSLKTCQIIRTTPSRSLIWPSSNSQKKIMDILGHHDVLNIYLQDSESNKLNKSAVIRVEIEGNTK